MDALAQQVHILERVGAADVLDRPLLALDPLGRIRHHAAHPLQARERDVGADVHDDQALQTPRVGGRVLDRDAPAHGVPEQGEPVELEAPREGGHVVGHRGHPVVVVGRGVAVAVAPLIEREHAPAGHEALGQVVPDARVAGDPVEQDDGRRVRRPPVEIVQGDAVDPDGALDEGHDRGSLIPGQPSVNLARLAYVGGLTVEWATRHPALSP